MGIHLYFPDPSHPVQTVLALTHQFPCWGEFLSFLHVDMREPLYLGPSKFGQMSCPQRTSSQAPGQLPFTLTSGSSSLLDSDLQGGVPTTWRFPHFVYGCVNLHSPKPSGNENLESSGHYLIYIMGFTLEIKQ